MNGFRNIRRAVGFLALAAAMTATFGGTAMAQDAPGWSAHGSITLKGGSERHIGELDLFVPLWQDNDSLFYVDLRGQMDDSENQEGNVGFGYRQMGENWILGGYGFFDWRTSDETGNTFTQGTLGFEAMTEALDLRANVYIPEGGEQTAAEATEVTLVGSSLQMRAGFERALPGFDAEVGYRLWKSDSGKSEIRAFAGGYYFTADDYETVAGPRGRVEARLFDIGFLGEGSRFTIGAEVTNDGVRDTQGFAMARLTIPLGTGRRSARGGLQRRMTDYVVRDVDVMTGTAATGAAEAVAYLNTGVAVGDVTTLTNADDVVAELTGDLGNLYILDGSAGDFAIDDQLFVVNANVLLGGGSSIELIGLDSGASATFTAPGARPTVSGSLANEGAVFVGWKSMVIGLDIENTSGAASSYGIHVDGSGGNFIIGNSITTNSANGYGIFLDDSSVNTISGNNITTSGADAYGLNVTGGSGNAIIGNSITTTGDNANGMYLLSTWLNNIDGNYVTTEGSDASGIRLITSNSNNLDNNIIETDQIGLLMFSSEFNSGTGNSYSGLGIDCVQIGGSLNTIDLCQ